MFTDALFWVMSLTGLATTEMWGGVFTTSYHGRCWCSGGSKRTL
jgi:hypothetical protein